LYLSAFFEATRDEYYKQLYSVSAKGTWNEWLIYFLNGVALQTEDVLSRAERINDLLNKWKIKVASNASNIPMLIVQYFAVNPYLTTNRITEDLKISYSTAKRGIQKLEEANIIKQINSNKRDKIYCATEILAILEEPTRITGYLQQA
jgi:Fic family protein